MPMTFRMWDEAIPGGRSGDRTVTVDRAPANLRGLLGICVRQEVARYNQSLPETFHGLVQPEESEQLLNGSPKVRKPLNWEAQLKRTCASFEKNGFLVMIDGQQVTELDAPLELEDDSEVQFIKLAPLAGG